MIFVKIHCPSHKVVRKVISLCDETLLGKRFEEGNRQLDVREQFYQGNLMSREKVVPFLLLHSREDATFNIVGEESVACALEAGLIGQHTIGKVAGIPFSLVF